LGIWEALEHYLAWQLQDYETIVKFEGGMEIRHESNHRIVNLLPGGLICIHNLDEDDLVSFLEERNIDALVRKDHPVSWHASGPKSQVIVDMIEKLSAIRLIDYADQAYIGSQYSPSYLQIHAKEGEYKITLHSGIQSKTDLRSVQELDMHMDAMNALAETMSAFHERLQCAAKDSDVRVICAQKFVFIERERFMIGISQINDGLYYAKWEKETSEGTLEQVLERLHQRVKTQIGKVRLKKILN
jgi:hypothetical protein